MKTTTTTSTSTTSTTPWTSTGLDDSRRAFASQGLQDNSGAQIRIFTQGPPHGATRAPPPGAQQYPSGEHGRFMCRMTLMVLGWQEVGVGLFG